MLQLCRSLDLAQEPLGAQRRAEVRMQHLDGHITLVLEIVREVHGGHAALPKFTVSAVAVGKGGGETGDDIGR